MGAGFNPNQMNTERVDGWNPLAVIDAYKRKKQLLLEGKGPVPAGRGHLPYVAATARPTPPLTAPRKRFEAWWDQDPIVEYRKQLVEAGVATEAELR